MIYLEMSRDEEHGGAGWGFTECLWSPSRKSNGSHWSHWDLLMSVKKGDTILHLRGKTGTAAFVGYSFASSDGYIANSRPPLVKGWVSPEYYRVDLVDFHKFDDPIPLNKVFYQQGKELSPYFKTNDSKPKGKREHLFFVIQRGRLQCLNGAYLSEVSPELANILLGPDFSGNASLPRPPAISVKTGTQIVQLRARVGQQQFSENVRTNFGNKCCFPGCKIVDREFLIGAHISRWVDNQTHRGDTSNGLCLCLFHDKAFEMGMFTLTEDYQISVNRKMIMKSEWAQHNVLPYAGQKISLSQIPPSVESIHDHWDRIGYRPSN
jgi:hypothetical protein